MSSTRLLVKYERKLNQEGVSSIVRIDYKGIYPEREAYKLVDNVGI